MDASNNSSLNVVESMGMETDPSNGLKQGEIASELTHVTPKFVERVGTHATTSGLDDPLQRDVLVTTGNLNTTDTGSTTASIFPGVLWLANPFVVNRLVGSYAYTGSIVVTYQFNIPPGAYGLYVISAIPSSVLPVGGNYTELDGVAQDNAVTSRQGLHVMINVASSTSGQLTLPWLSHQDFNIVTTAFNSWRVVVYCLAPLKLNTGGAGTAPYSVFVRGGPDFKLLLPTFQMGKLSNVASAVSGAASSLAGIPALEPIAAPIAFVAGLASRALSALGFTRHTDVAAPVHMKQTASCNIVNIDGNDTGTVLALSGANTNSLEGHGGADSFDNMTFKHLFARPTFVHSISWSTTDATGTGYLNIGVSPFWAWLPTGSTHRLTVAGYVGLPFTYWRGTMHYEVIIASSALMRGSLQIYWTPANGSPTNDVTNTCYNIICDIESNEVCRFSVGYNSQRPMLENVILDAASPANALNNSACNGHLGFKVINPLTSMNGAASVVVTVWAWADEDMRFALPRDYFPDTNNAVPGMCLPFPTGINYQSGSMNSNKVLGNSESVVMSHVLVPSSPPVNIANLFSGEEIVSIRPLLQKFSRYFYNDVTYSALLTASGLTVFVDHFGGLRIDATGNGDTPVSVLPYNATTFQAFNWFRHYSLLFDSMAGSTRYKIFCTATMNFPSTGPLVFVTPEIVHPTSGFLTNGPTVPMLNDFTVIEPSDTGRACEFTVPYYHPYYGVTCRGVQVNNTAANMRANAYAARVDGLTVRSATTLAVAGTTDQDIHIFTAGGPDSRFNTFRRVPGITSRSTDGFPASLKSWTVE